MNPNLKISKQRQCYRLKNSGATFIQKPQNSIKYTIVTVNIVNTAFYFRKKVSPFDSFIILAFFVVVCFNNMGYKILVTKVGKFRCNVR